MPHLKDKNIPKLLVLNGPSLEELIAHVNDRIRVEITFLHKAVPVEILQEELLELLHEPNGKWCEKRLLRTVHDLPWDVFIYDLLENILVDAVADLKMRRELCHVFDNMRIEEGFACL